MLASLYLWFKVLHILAVIAWMAGMMYLPRLFVYHHQSQKGGEAEQFFIQMERRLLKGIINPSLIALWVFGILLVLSNPVWAGQLWLWGKIVLVLAITAVHGIYAKAVRQFGEGKRP
ncbi:MAG: CopD family protein, partial [Pseudomonadota bacterium]